VATYGYDNVNQLTSIMYAFGQTTLGNLTYTYDAAGNRTTLGGSLARTRLPQPLASAVYDAGNRIQSWAGQFFSYDSNGNLASDGLTSYAWNARDQLTALTGGISASFSYDAGGRRRSKLMGGVNKSFLFDGANVVQELSGGSVTANLVTGLGIDETFTRTDGVGTSVLLTDALGSTLELADASATLQTHYTFEPFGSTVTSGAQSANSLQFAGRENDGDGLYFNRARFYSQSQQRWISEDPIGFAGGDPNVYSYVGNQATMWRDPTGLIKFDLPPGHPCHWPPDDQRRKSRSNDQPPTKRPFSWWLMCSPLVVPDLIPDFPDIQIDGPLGTRLIQVRYDGQPVIRLDYGPYPGTGGDSMLHLHLDAIWPDWHISLDPRMWW
jgi:RHS repeat-associated protein